MLARGLFACRVVCEERQRGEGAVGRGGRRVGCRCGAEQGAGAAAGAPRKALQRSHPQVPTSPLEVQLAASIGALGVVSISPAGC